VHAADAAGLVRAALGEPFVAGHLKSASNVDVIAVGKAAGPMLDAFAGAAGRPLRTVEGIGPVRPETLPARAEWRDSGHPIPDARSVGAARRALEIAAAAAPDDVLIVLLSGGASALMALPAAGITLEAKQDTVRRLLRGGATIDELNAVRKHLSGIKGGRLAAATPASVATLVISDVVGDDLSVIGSGPTMPDPSTFADAMEVLERRGGRAAFPAAVVELLQRGLRGEVAETPKADDPRLGRSVARIIGGRMTAVAGAVDAARSRGYDVHVIERPIVGEAREAARLFAEDVRQACAHLRAPACVIGAGETTVHVTGDGLGGRNQEFALAMLAYLAGPERPTQPPDPKGPGLPAAFGSIGTDGIDGPTDAAGAIVDATTADRAGALGLDPRHFLDNNDSNHFFSALDDLLRTGPTGTNVGDVQVALIA
jgi:hydroxypyruvate reductase